jgi:hypothetical protein
MTRIKQRLLVSLLFALLAVSARYWISQYRNSSQSETLKTVREKVIPLAGVLPGVSQVDLEPSGRM